MMNDASERFIEFLRGMALEKPPRNNDLQEIGIPVLSRFYPEGTRVLEEGEPTREFKFIASGWALAYKSMPNGQRVVLDFLQKGDLVSATAVPSRAPNSFDCATDVTTFEIDIRKSQLVTQSPFLASTIMSRMARSNLIAIEHLANVARRPPLERLAFLFMEITHRYERSNGGRTTRFTFPFTQRDIADALGLSTIHVNRLLRTLREARLLHFHHWTVEILDRERLMDVDPAYLSML